MRNEISVYPNEIDPLLFFSDISIEQTDIIEHYIELIKDNKYSEASQLLNMSEVFFYGAWVLNLFGNQLNKIGAYLLSKKKKTFFIYQDNEPDANEGTIWIGN